MQRACAHTLAGLLFPPTHPSYETPFGKQLEWIEKITVQDLETFHAAHYGPNRMIVIAAGDVDPQLVKTAVQESFEGWEPKGVPDIQTVPLEPGHAENQLVFVPGKTNVSVFMGHAIPMNRLDPDYLPVYVANAVLGGNFSARLGKRVRQEQGLTYSIYSGLLGFGKNEEGGFQITMTLAPDRLREGIQSTEDQVRLFTRNGITAQEVEDTKNMIVGNFKIVLATTRGMAEKIRSFEEDGLGADYLSRYPALVNALTRKQVNQAIDRYWHPDQLNIVASGTVKERDFKAVFEGGPQAADRGQSNR